MSQDPAISNVVNPLKIKTPQVVIRLNYPKLSQFGITPEEVFSTLRATFWGLEVFHILRQREEIKVYLKYNWTQKPDLKTLALLPIKSQKGEMIPLGKIADIKVEYIPGEIPRLNGERAVTLLAEVEGNFFKIASKLKEQFKKLPIPKGYRIEVTGQYKVLKKTFYEILFVIIGAIIFIYLILLTEFKSWIFPLIILITIPFSLIGAILALVITKESLNVSVAMGIITLIGVCVNNAIVLLDFAKYKLNKGLPKKKVLIEAALTRLRSILLTSLTTIFALIPTALGWGVGANFFQAFAITVIGGLFTSTLATLIIVPVLTDLLLK
jgi:multidrug efflux pump subunit AcrB